LSSLLLRDGALVRRDGSAIITDDADSCECCGPTPAADLIISGTYNQFSYGTGYRISPTCQPTVAAMCLSQCSPRLDRTHFIITPTTPVVVPQTSTNACENEWGYPRQQSLPIADDFPAQFGFDGWAGRCGEQGGNACAISSEAPEYFWACAFAKPRTYPTSGGFVRFLQIHMAMEVEHAEFTSPPCSTAGITTVKPRAFNLDVTFSEGPSFANPGTTRVFVNWVMTARDGFGPGNGLVDSDVAFFEAEDQIRFGFDTRIGFSAPIQPSGTWPTEFSTLFIELVDEGYPYRMTMTPHPENPGTNLIADYQDNNSISLVTFWYGNLAWQWPSISGCDNSP